jgi:hypothetical protein
MTEPPDASAYHLPAICCGRADAAVVLDEGLAVLRDAFALDEKTGKLC